MVYGIGVMIGARARSGVGVLAGATVLFGCAPADSSEASAPVPRWEVSPTPRFSVSGVGGVGGEFQSVMDLATLGDGRIVVADIANRLLVLNPDGTYLQTIGREGAGPGEFARGPVWVQRMAGDTILAWDFGNNRRLSFFTADGSFARSVSVSAEPLITYSGALANGSLVGTAYAMDVPGRTVDEGEVLVAREWMDVLVRAADGSPLAVITRQVVH